MRGRVEVYDSLNIKEMRDVPDTVQPDHHHGGCLFDVSGEGQVYLNAEDVEYRLQRYHRTVHKNGWDKNNWRRHCWETSNSCFCPGRGQLATVIQMKRWSGELR